MKTTIVAPGKMILLGEYAVLEGAPALVAAINRHAAVTIDPDTDESTVLAPTIDPEPAPFSVDHQTGYVNYGDDVSLTTKRRLKYFSSAIKSVFLYFRSQHEMLPSLAITLDTHQFFDDRLQGKLGVGSSAALSVAVAGAYFTALDRDITKMKFKQEIFFVAQRAHFFAQGRMGSGIDIAASAYGGIIEYEIERCQSRSPTSHNSYNGLYILPIWSGESASTRILVGQVNALKETHPARFYYWLERMTLFAREGCRAFGLGDYRGFMSALHLYFDAMKHLGEESDAPIISPVHQKLADIVYSCGAVYKPSGAGGGDLGIAVTMSPGVLDTVKTRLAEAGFTPIDLAIDPFGCRITSNHESLGPVQKARV